MNMLLERVRGALGTLYDVERELGAGGMGIVYLARERALGHRPVALKILRPEIATAVAAERFQREAEMLAAIHHPSVVVIHRVGAEQGLHFFAMELLHGTLADRREQGPLPEADVRQLGMQLLQGLARVHDAGIIHRDIKPSNIFLRDDGQPVLGDFGIAKDLGRTDGGLTETGHSPFTPWYYAPEVLADASVTPAADLYTVGLVLYEAVTGRRWKPGTEPAGGDWSGVSDGLARVLHRALVTDPAGRWGSAREFAEAVRTVETPARPSWKVMAGVVAAAVTVLALGVLGVISGNGVPPQSDVAILPFAVENGPADGGAVLAVWVGQNLERAFGDEGLRVTPEELSAPWARSLAPEDSLPATAWDDLHTDNVLRGTIRVRGDSMIVDADIIGRNRQPVSLVHVERPQSDWDGAGLMIANAVVGAVRPERKSAFVGLRAFSGPTPALESLIAAELAFQRDNWAAADRLYADAIRQDSNLVMAWWGLYNARRWQRVPPDIDLAALYAEHGDRLIDLERLLIRAELAATVPARLAIYDTAIRLYPWDAYPELLRGNELFHRGALVGRGLDSAVAALQAAADHNPYLAATWDMLIWAHTRRGDEAGARAALGRRLALGAQEPMAGFSLALSMRFDPPTASGRRMQEAVNSPDASAVLGRSVRLGLAFGIPDAQRMIGAQLAAAPDPALRTQGHVTQALAFLGLGRPGAALEHLELAGQASGDDEFAFQAAQWALVLPALDLPGVADSQRTRARERIVASLAGGSRAARAHWTLLVDALARGGDAGVHLAALRDDPRAAGLATIGAALEAAAGGDTAAALRITDSLQTRSLHADLRDPIERAVLYVMRGRWLATRDTRAAEEALRWFENADFADWPQGYPQAAELDWALEPYARYVLGWWVRDDEAHRCAVVAPALRWWSDPEPALRPLVNVMRGWTQSCPAAE